MWQSWNVTTKKNIKKKIKNRWVSCKYHLFCKLIISRRWTTASWSCATCSGSKAFQTYLSTQKWSGRKDSNSLVMELHHDTHCHCIVYSGFKEKVRHRIHIEQSSAFSCAVCHWGHKAVALARSRVTTTSTETAAQHVPCWASQWRHQMWPGDVCGHLSASRASLPPSRITTCLGLLGHIGLMT